MNDSNLSPDAQSSPAIGDAVKVTPPAPPPGAVNLSAQQNNGVPVGATGNNTQVVEKTESPTTSFLKSINWIEFGFMVLGAAGLFYTISYYRFQMANSKERMSDVQQQLDELKINVQNTMKGKYQTIS